MIECGCIQKGQFRFIIDAPSCDITIYRDFSIWADAPGCSVPDSYTITLTSGDCVKEITVNTSGPTDISSLNLPDGIYEVTTISCGVTQKRSLAIIPRLLCCLDNYRNRFDADQEAANTVADYINQLEATAKYGRIDISEEFFRKANNIIKNLNCDC